MERAKEFECTCGRERKCMIVTRSALSGAPDACSPDPTGKALDTSLKMRRFKIVNAGGKRNAESPLSGLIRIARMVSLTCTLTVECLGGINPALDHWKLLALGYYHPLDSLVFGNGSYLVPTQSGLLGSDDGLNWESRQCGFVAAKVGHTASGWVAVGVGYGGFRRISRDTNAEVAVSLDGHVWSGASVNVGLNILYGAACGNGVLAAVGAVGEGRFLLDLPDREVFVPTGGVVVVTVDRTNWQVAVRATNAFRDVVFFNGIFTASTDTQVYASTDGFDWSVAPDSSRLKGGVFGNGWLLAAPGVRSEDGIHWETVATTNAPSVPVTLSFDGEQFLAVPSYGQQQPQNLVQARFWSSPDGIVWEPHIIDAYGRVAGVAFDGRRYVAIVDTGSLSYFFASDDIPRPRLSIGWGGASDALRVGVSVADWRNYRLEVSEDFSRWQVWTKIASGPGTNSFSVSTPVGVQQFFRVRER